MSTLTTSKEELFNLEGSEVQSAEFFYFVKENNIL
jgi:hypothetical protein